MLTRSARESRAWRRGFLIALVTAGFLVRLPSLDAPALSFHATRQYRSALIARELYEQSRTELPDWQRKATTAAARVLPALEPAIVEHVAAALYRVTRGERLWLPRLASVVFWILGALCLAAISRQLWSYGAATVALAFCLFTPYGVRASESFQPDPLMVALVCAGLWTLLRYHESPTSGRLLTTAVLSAAALLVKPVAVFFLVPVFAALAAGRGDTARALRDWRAGLWLALTLLPAGAYYVVGLQQTGLSAQAEGSFFFSLLATSAYWKGWLEMVSRVIGVGLLAVGGLGLILVRTRPASLVLGSLWAGYLAFGLVFNYHIHTHDYYSLPLIPIVGLSVAGVAHTMWQRLATWCSTPRTRAAAGAGLLGAAAAALWIGSPTPSSGAAPPPAATYERLGDRLRHTTRLVVLDGDYGFPLFYHGRMAGATWPLSFDIKKERLEGREPTPTAARFGIFSGADYFVASTVIELNAQPDLATHLEAHFPRLSFESASDRPVLVYDLRASTLEPNRRALHFVALRDGSAMTGAQSVRLRGASRVAWSALASNPSFMVDPDFSIGSAQITVEIDRSKPLPTGAAEDGLITIRRTDGMRVPPVSVSLRVLAPGSSHAPVGSFDVPPVSMNSATGPIFFSGWALDDIEIAWVRLYRDPVGPDPPGQPILVADISQTDDARPDVERLYAEWPLSWRAGWGYVVQRAAMRDRGPGPYTFHVDVRDVEGHVIRLGSRTFEWREP